MVGATNDPQTDFHHEADLLEIRGTNSDAHPALVLPPALFHTALRSLQLRRKLEDDRRKRVTELEKFHNRVQQIDDENDMYVRQVDQIYAQIEVPDITAEEHAKLFECDQDCRKRAEENDAERALLVQREREICQEQGAEYREENEALYAILPLLEDVFEKAYIIPEWAYRHDEPKVCIERFESLESEPASAQALDANPNINDADRVDGTDPNHDLGLKEPIRKVNAQAAIANKADAELTKFRDSYAAELKKFIAENAHRTGVSKLDLKTEFGPIWLTRHLRLKRDVAREGALAIQISKEYQAVMDAKEIEALILKEDEERDRVIEIRARNIRDPDTFGHKIPWLKSCWIEDWCDGAAGKVASVDGELGEADRDWMQRRHIL